MEQNEALTWAKDDPGKPMLLTVQGSIEGVAEVIVPVRRAMHTQWEFFMYFTRTGSLSMGFLPSEIHQYMINGALMYYSKTVYCYSIQVKFYYEPFSHRNSIFQVHQTIHHQTT